MFSKVYLLVLFSVSVLVAELSAQLQISVTVPESAIDGDGSFGGTANPSTFSYDFGSQSHLVELRFAAPSGQVAQFTGGDGVSYFYLHYVSIEDDAVLSAPGEHDYFEPITASFTGLQGTLTQLPFASDGYTGATYGTGDSRRLEIGAAFTLEPNSTVSFQSVTLSWIVPAGAQFTFTPNWTALANLEYYGGTFGYAAAVPEPATVGLLAGLLGLLVVVRRRRSRRVFSSAAG